MPVTLQVVGLFYKYSLPIPFNSGQKITVREVLDFAKGQHPDDLTFDYSVGKGKQSEYVDYIMVHFPKVFQSPVSGNLYLPGTFTLAQTFTKPVKDSYTVWQYYVRDEHGAPVSPGKTKEIPFGQAKVVEDGFTVIWRLVEIFKATPLKFVPVIPVPNATQIPSPLPNGGPVMNARLAQVIGMPAEKSTLPATVGAPMDTVPAKSGP